MPRRFNRRRRYARRRRPTARKGGVMGYALKALRIANFLKTIVNAEVKKLDTALSATPDNSTGYVQPLTNIAQGDGASNRDGNSVKPKYLKINMNFTQNASATATIVRFLILVDKQTQGGIAPTIAEVLASANTYASLNQLNVGRFFIMRDLTRVFSDSGSKITQYETVINFKKLHIRFDGSAGGDWIRNPIFLLAISNEATNTPTLVGNARLGYYDN